MEFSKFMQNGTMPKWAEQKTSIYYVNTFCRRRIIEAAAREKLRPAAKFFFHGNISADLHCDSLRIPARAY